jgi:hypothetical protein
MKINCQEVVRAGPGQELRNNRFIVFEFLGLQLIASFGRCPPAPSGGACLVKILLPIVAPGGVGEVADLLVQFPLDRLGERKGAPFALSEVGPVVVAQADDADLGGLGPVLSHLEGGGDPLLAVEPGEGFAAEALEAVAVVGVQVRTDEVSQGAVSAPMWRLVLVLGKTKRNQKRRSGSARS